MDEPRSRCRNNATIYDYVYNLQGDVLAPVDVDGVLQASYTYDAWGRSIPSAAA